MLETLKSSGVRPRGIKTLNKAEFSEKDKILTLPSRFRTGWAYKCVPVYTVPFLGEAHLTFETLKTFVNECV